MRRNDPVGLARTIVRRESDGFATTPSWNRRCRSHCVGTCWVFWYGIASGLGADVDCADSGSGRFCVSDTRMDIRIGFRGLADGWFEHVELLPCGTRDSADSGDRVPLGTGARVRMYSAGLSAFLESLSMAGSADFSDSLGDVRIRF